MKKTFWASQMINEKKRRRKKYDFKDLRNTMFNKTRTSSHLRSTWSESRNKNEVIDLNFRFDQYLKKKKDDRNIQDDGSIAQFSLTMIKRTKITGKQFDVLDERTTLSFWDRFHGITQ